MLREIEQDKSSDPLQPAAVLVGSRLLASRLELGLYPALNSKGLGINLKFLTFPDMARSLALTPPFPESAPEAGDFLKLVLATNLLQDLNPGHYFYQVREASGLIRSIIAEHRDLQDGLIIGEQWDLLKDDLKSGNHSRKLSSLFEIFGQLEQRLKPYGQDGKMFQTATERAGKFSQVFGTNRLFLYGFYDFTAVQRQLVRAVSQSAGIAALMVQPKNNGLLAGYGREVLNFYQRDLGLETEEIFSQSDSTNLSRLKKSLSLDQRVEMKADQSLAVVFAPGIDREALEICREIMRLVQKENLRFDEIGILVRDYAAYGRILRETLELHGIPFYLAPKKPLSDFSSVRALLNLFQIPEREYSRRSLIGFLSGHAVKKGDDGAAPELAGLFDIVTREALIVKGKDEWKGRLDQYLATMKKGLERAKTGKGSSEEDAEKLERKQRLIEKKIQAAEKLREISAGLISELEGLKAQKSFPSLSDLGRKLCDKYLDLGFEGEAGLKEQVVKIFREIAGLDQAGVAADYQTFLTLVQAGVAGAGVDYGKFQQGGVCVTDLMAARGVRFKAVIIPGLCEGSFPLRLSENPLLADDDRRWVNGLCKKAGLPGYLSEKRKLPQEERLLFYLACGQADEFLILTSPWLELESNREKPASYLLTYALERMVPEEVEFNRLSKLAEKNGGWIRWVELSGFAPEQEGLALSADDWEENKIERAQDLKELSHLAGGGTRRAIEIAAERWLKEDFGLFTGFPGRDQKYDSRTFSIISRKISPSLLQDFLRCPFEYFLKRVLEVEALTEPEYL